MQYSFLESVLAQLGGTADSTLIWWHAQENVIAIFGYFCELLAAKNDNSDSTQAHLNCCLNIWLN